MPTPYPSPRFDGSVLFNSLIMGLGGDGCACNEVLRVVENTFSVDYSLYFSFFFLLFLPTTTATKDFLPWDLVQEFRPITR